MAKLTPWFPGHIKPVRKGVYMQRDGVGEDTGYQYWDGALWSIWHPTINGAANAKHKAGRMHQDDKWRGLASRPK
jgi:hypothetical protein